MSGVEAVPTLALVDDSRVRTAREVLTKSLAIDYDGDASDRETALSWLGRLEAQLLLVLRAIDEAAQLAARPVKSQ